MTPFATEELKDFNRYIAEVLNGKADSMTMEQMLLDYREYQRQLSEVRAKLREAEESSAKGLSKPFDLDDFIERGRKRLANLGITD